MIRASRRSLRYSAVLTFSVGLAAGILILRPALAGGGSPRNESRAAAQESDSARNASQAGSQLATHDWTQDLPMKIKEPFTLAAVGDLIEKRPLADYDDPKFQAAIKIIRDADVSFANFESNIIDERHYNGPLAGFNGPREVGPDVKAMGFKIVNRAANHVLDSDKEGFFATNDFLSQAGLVYAGAGRNLDEARAPNFWICQKGVSASWGRTRWRTT